MGELQIYAHSSTKAFEKDTVLFAVERASTERRSTGSAHYTCSLCGDGSRDSGVVCAVWCACGLGMELLREGKAT